MQYFSANSNKGGKLYDAFVNVKTDPIHQSKQAMVRTFY